LGLGDLTQTRFYQEAFDEGQQKANTTSVLRMVKMGFNQETIAQALAIPLTEVQKVIEWENNSSNSSGED
jgi:predicted transposase YdaD